MHLFIVAVLFFLSGMTGLVYEVLWMKELSLLFGNTAQATATTLATFFTGMAAGGWFWGRRSESLANPLVTYGVLEAAIAITALMYFGILEGYQYLYGVLYPLTGHQRTLLLGVKFFLSLGILFPPAFFMGGTWPVLTQHLAGQQTRFANRATILYTVNTLGAALGAWVAGFYLPRWFGFDQSYLLAIGLTALVAGSAIFIGYFRGTNPTTSSDESQQAADSGPDQRWLRLPPFELGIIAIFSGLGTLGLQVLWTNMFTQILHNSVYTFSIILVVFLIGLALGAGVANWLIRRVSASLNLLAGLLIGSGLLIGLTPFVFYSYSNGLEYLARSANWNSYVLDVTGATGLVLLLPCIGIGTVFPYLLKLAKADRESPGRIVGRLAALNTAGSIAGSIAAGFFILEFIGLWGGIQLVSALYFLAAFIVINRAEQAPSYLRYAPVAGLILLISVINPSNLPLINVDSANNEQIIDVKQGSSGTVAVVEKNGSRRIKINNYYTLGSTGARQWEELQAHIPLFVHPDPKKVFFIGMGTGITAGASLLHPVDEVRVTEIVPEAVSAAQEYFKPYVNGLFEDPRTQILIEDGRNVLQATDERFDVVIGDLFIPWRSGVGNLYTLQHFQSVKDRLKPKGLFMQWIPLFQVSPEEFGIIARTMLESFPRVTLWRGDFFLSKPVIGLMGHKDPGPLQPETVREKLRYFQKQNDDSNANLGPTGSDSKNAVTLASLLGFYLGNLSETPNMVSRFPVQTDNWPIVSYQAPITQRQVRAGKKGWFLGETLVSFYQELLKRVPPEQDPYLSKMTAEQHQFVRRALLFYEQKLERQKEAIRGDQSPGADIPREQEQ